MKSLSNTLFDECYEQIYDELENINDDLTKQLLSAEFKLADVNNAPHSRLSFARLSSAREVAAGSPRKMFDKSPRSILSTAAAVPKSYSLSFDDNDEENSGAFALPSSSRKMVSIKQQTSDNANEEGPNLIEKYVLSSRADDEDRLEQLTQLKLSNSNNNNDDASNTLMNEENQMNGSMQTTGYSDSFSN